MESDTGSFRFTYVTNSNLHKNYY